MRRVFWCICLLTLSFGGYAQQDLSTITKKEYLDDFDFLVEVIKKQHPNPYRFIGEKEFDTKADQLRLKLQHDPSYVNFILLNPAILIKDVHISVSPDGLLFRDLEQKMNFFPFSISFFSGKAYVNQHIKELAVGTEILRINGESIQDIITRLPIPTDGAIPITELKDFSIFLSILYPQAKEYKLEYNHNGMPRTLKIQSTDYSSFYYNTAHAVLPVDVISSQRFIEGRKLNEDTYLLTITSFNLSEEYAYYYLNRIFEKIKKDGIKHLVFDIRGNSGGLLSNIPLYYSFISKEKNFKNTYRYATKVIDIAIPKYLVDENERQMTTTDIASLNNFMYQRFDKAEDSAYYIGNNRLDESYVENYPQDRNAFQGEVVLLVDNGTISSAAYFASLFKENKRGAIVGSETGSCSNFTTAAWFLNYKLPNTGFTVSIPRSEIFFNDITRADNKECRGVMPDYAVSNFEFQEGISHTVDAELEMAIQVVKGKGEGHNTVNGLQ